MMRVLYFQQRKWRLWPVPPLDPEQAGFQPFGTLDALLALILFWREGALSLEWSRLKAFLMHPTVFDSVYKALRPLLPYMGVPTRDVLEEVGDEISPQELEAVKGLPIAELTSKELLRRLIDSLPAEGYFVGRLPMTGMATSALGALRPTLNEAAKLWESGKEEDALETLRRGMESLGPERENALLGYIARVLSHARSLIWREFATNLSLGALQDFDDPSTIRIKLVETLGPYVAKGMGSPWARVRPLPEGGMTKAAFQYFAAFLDNTNWKKVYNAQQRQVILNNLLSSDLNVALTQASELIRMSWKEVTEAWAEQKKQAEESGMGALFFTPHPYEEFAARVLMGVREDRVLQPEGLFLAFFGKVLDEAMRTLAFQVARSGLGSEALAASVPIIDAVNRFVFKEEGLPPNYRMWLSPDDLRYMLDNLGLTYSVLPFAVRRFVDFLRDPEAPRYWENRIAAAWIGGFADYLEHVWSKRCLKQVAQVGSSLFTAPFDLAQGRVILITEQLEEGEGGSTSGRWVPIAPVTYDTDSNTLELSFIAPKDWVILTKDHPLAGTENIGIKLVLDGHTVGLARNIVESQHPFLGKLVTIQIPMPAPKLVEAFFQRTPDGNLVPRESVDVETLKRLQFELWLVNQELTPAESALVTALSFSRSQTLVGLKEEEIQEYLKDKRYAISGQVLDSNSPHLQGMVIQLASTLHLVSPGMWWKPGLMRVPNQLPPSLQEKIDPKEWSRFVGEVHEYNRNLRSDPYWRKQVDNWERWMHVLLDPILGPGLVDELLQETMPGESIWDTLDRKRREKDLWSLRLVGDFLDWWAANRSKELRTKDMHERLIRHMEEAVARYEALKEEKLQNVSWLDLLRELPTIQGDLEMLLELWQKEKQKEQQAGETKPSPQPTETQPTGYLPKPSPLEPFVALPPLPRLGSVLELGSTFFA